MAEGERPLKMTVRLERVGETAVLHLEGTVDLDEALHLEEVFDSVVESEAKAAVFDLSKVSYVSSGGLQFFMVYLWEGEGEKSHGVNCILTNMNDRVRILFENMDLLKFFKSAPTVDDALKLLGGNGES